MMSQPVAAILARQPWPRLWQRKRHHLIRWPSLHCQQDFARQTGKLKSKSGRMRSSVFPWLHVAVVSLSVIVLWICRRLQLTLHARQGTPHKHLTADSSQSSGTKRCVSVVALPRLPGGPLAHKCSRSSFLAVLQSMSPSLVSTATLKASTAATF